MGPTESIHSSAAVLKKKKGGGGGGRGGRPGLPVPNGPQYGLCGSKPPLN